MPPYIGLGRVGMWLPTLAVVVSMDVDTRYLIDMVYVECTYIPSYLVSIYKKVVKYDDRSLQKQLGSYL